MSSLDPVILQQHLINGCSSPSFINTDNKMYMDHNDIQDYLIQNIRDPHELRRISKENGESWAARVQSMEAKKNFPAMASVVGLIPRWKIKDYIDRIHGIVENRKCKLDLFKQEKEYPTITGTRLLEEYLDHRSTLLFWQILAEEIDVDTKPDFSTLNSIEDYRSEAGQFSNWFKAHIEQLIHLEELELSYMNFNSLPPEIGQLVNLEILHIAGNHLQALPSEFGQLINLYSIGLSDNNLKSLPPEIIKLGKLEMLDLSKNELRSLHPEIVKLTNLKELDLSKNELQILPREIGRLTDLEKLYLNNNRLQVLPRDIGKLVHLRELYLEKNKLQILPREIENLINLQRFNLSKNKLSSFSISIRELTNLIEFDLSKNDLQTLPPQIEQRVKQGTLKLSVRKRW